MRRIVFIFLFSYLSFGSVAFADLIIVSSTAPNYSPGQVIQKSQVIRLKNGTRISLIGQDGPHVRLVGPYSGVLDNPAGKTGSTKTGLIEKLASLFDEKKTNVIGAFRSAVVGSGQQTPRTPWLINIRKSGRHCILADSPVVLWRPKSRRTISLTLKSFNSKKSEKIKWKAGESLIPWPANLELKDKEKYKVVIKRPRKVSRIEVHIIARNLASSAHYAVKLAEEGCRPQALLMIDNLE
jgi:hypothetical protein